MTKFILLFFLISVNEKVSYFKDLDYINFDGRDQTSKRDASFKVMSIDENNIVITNLKSKKSLACCHVE
ncbi:MAG: hypothetical protein UZ12_BCD005001415 [Bacteroidetes bacterium OLB12]|nr:MAG: hypothetical protein UZ12_BCD005001415 [Bacteroidetes bacterium OLB12]